MSWIWAVGVIIGAAFQAIINSLVNDVISPLIGLFANTDLTYFVCDGRGCGNPLWCIFDRSDQFHHYGSDYFPDGKRDERAGWSWQKEGAGKTCCENVPLLQKQGLQAEATRCPYCTSMLEVKKEDKKEENKQ